MIKRVTQEDIDRERKAVETFVNLFDGSFKKLDEWDVDFQVFDRDNKPISFVEVKGRKGKSARNSFPLPVALTKLLKVFQKRVNPVIIWAVEDGIIYGHVTKLDGNIRFGGRKPREGAVNDEELMVFYFPQPHLYFVRYRETGDAEPPQKINVVDIIDF